MAVDQTVLFTILPRGVTVPGDEMPVSVLVSPRLRGADRLGAFPDWLIWTRRLKDNGLTLTVRCGGAEREAAIATGVLEPDLWEALFDEETFVRSHTAETYEDHGILSFSVRETLSAVKQAWQEAGVTLALPEDPDDPKQREGSLNRRRLRDITDGFDIHWDGNLAPRWRIVNRARNRSTDPAAFVAAEPVLDGEGLIVGARDPNRVRAAARDFSVFHHMPTPDRNEHPLPKDPGKDLDFHQVVSALGSYPDLLRRLGLVFDITLPRAFVAETPLNKPGTLSVSETSFGWQTPADTPERPTAYLHTLLGQARLFAAAPRSITDPSAPTSVLGLLALDAKRFGVAQVDVDGAMHKAIMLADSIHDAEGNLVPGQGPELAPHPEVFDPGATLPALRSGGFSLYADRRGAALFDSLSRSRANNAAVHGGPAAPPFTAEDLVRGYRVDVWDAATGHWRSLHRRKGDYTLDAIAFHTDDEEGFVQMAATQPAPGAEPADKDLYLHECFARWAGWSLSAPSPGRALSRYADPDKAIPQDGDPDYETDEPAPAFPMKVRYRAVPGTLPSLRFGRRYRFRARAVDLAGNSLALDDPFAETLARAWALPQDPEGFAYLRYEPVPAPLFAIRDPRAVTDPGSALDRIVIRTWNDAPEKDADPAKTDAADRHLLPPRTSVEMGERHGIFDKGGKLDGAPAVWKIIGDRDKGELPDQEIEVAGKTDHYPVVPEEIVDPLPYLPDPFSRGVAIRDLPGAPAPSVGRVPDGGSAGSPVDYMPLDDANPRPGSATLIPFGEPAKWQKRTGIRLALREPAAEAADPRPVWHPDERLLTVFLPKGSMCVVPVSSFLELEDLKQMGVWQWIREYAERLAVASPAPDPLRPGEDVDRVAHVLQRVVEGGHWMLTPPHLLTLVHAVQQPLGVPTFAALAVDHEEPGYGPLLEAAPITGRPDPVEMAGLTAARALGAMDAYLLGALKVHAESTQKVSLKAEWLDPVDDPAQPAPATEHHAAPVDEIPLSGTREGYLLADPATGRAGGYYDPEHSQIAFVRAGDFTGPAAAPAMSFYQTAAPRHQIGDGKRHRIAYTAVAASRFQEYFPRDGGLDFTRTSEPVTVDVPASARPLAPDAAFAVPTFGWQRQTETNIHRSVRFGGGLRIYLRRPWFSSGEGELLGVALWNNAYGTLDDTQRVRFKPYITQWGMDPLWDSGALGGWPSTWHFPNAAATDHAVTLEEGVSGPDGAPGRVDVAGFPVAFDPARGLWYADVTLNVPAENYMPFVRLALVRYQPHALADAKISRVSLGDFAQITPTRAALVTTDPHHARTVRVVVSGVAPRGPRATVSAAPPPADANPRATQVRVHVEERDPAIASDLGWNPAPAGTATVQAQFDAPSPADGDIALWAGVVTFAAIPEPGKYRLVIEEREFISAHYTESEDGAAVAPSRLVYAEIVPLNADLVQE
jgi:hypothetical protein